jgi:hypothetical protein
VDACEKEALSLVILQLSLLLMLLQFLLQLQQLLLQFLLPLWLLPLLALSVEHRPRQQQQHQPLPRR